MIKIWAAEKFLLCSAVDIDVWFPRVNGWRLILFDDFPIAAVVWTNVGDDFIILKFFEMPLDCSRRDSNGFRDFGCARARVFTDFVQNSFINSLTIYDIFYDIDKDLPQF